MKFIACVAFLAGSFALVDMASVLASTTAIPRTRDGKKGEGPKTQPDMMCLGQKVKMTAEQNQTIQQCGPKVMGKLRAQRNATGGAEQREPKREQRGEHHQRPPMKFLACKNVCMAQAVGLYDAAGQPVSDEIVATVISKNFPAQAAPRLTSEIQQCNAKAGNLTLDDCSSYRNIVNCYNFAILQVCDKDFIL